MEITQLCDYPQLPRPQLRKMPGFKGQHGDGGLLPPAMCGVVAGLGHGLGSQSGMAPAQLGLEITSRLGGALKHPSPSGLASSGFCLPFPTEE